MILYVIHIIVLKEQKINIHLGLYFSKGKLKRIHANFTIFYEEIFPVVEFFP